MSVSTTSHGQVIRIDNGPSRYHLEIETYFDGHIVLNIIGPRGGINGSVRVTVDDWREAVLATGIIDDKDPMSPDYIALAAHEPTSGIEDGRGAAGLPGGDPMPQATDGLMAQLLEDKQRPFTPTITTLPRRAHGHEEGCECPKCRNIQETLGRMDELATPTAEVF